MPLYLELHLLSGSNFTGSVIWSNRKVLHPPALRAEDGFKALVFLRTRPRTGEPWGADRLRLGLGAMSPKGASPGEGLEVGVGSWCYMCWGGHCPPPCSLPRQLQAYHCPASAPGCFDSVLSNSMPCRKDPKGQHTPFLVRRHSGAVSGSKGCVFWGQRQP